MTEQWTGIKKPVTNPLKKLHGLSFGNQRGRLGVNVLENKGSYFESDRKACFVIY